MTFNVNKYDIGVVYISIRHDKIEPVQFVKSILQDLESTKTQKTRFCSRFVPIQKTCAANIQEIEKTAKPLIEQVFNSTPSNIGKKVILNNTFFFFLQSNIVCNYLWM